jgi:transcription initiation factor TFIIF subunit alpha
MMRLDAKSIQNEIDRLAGKKPTPPRRRQHPLPPRPSPLSTPAPQPKKEEEDVPVSFTDYELLMAPNDDGFKYNLFRFRAGNKDQVDLTTFATPIKLNRKNPKPPPPPTTAPIAGSSRASAPDIKPMLGADGKVVIGKDGQPVMVTTVDGQEVPLSKQQLKERQKLNGKDSVADGKKKAFKRKTRQVFTVPEPIRQLRREERYPWVMEDASGTQKWVGKMTSQNEDGLYAFFVVNGQKEGTFDFIPTNRVYNFMPLRRYIGSTTAEEAEAMVCFLLAATFVSNAILTDLLSWLSIKRKIL